MKTSLSNGSATRIGWFESLCMLVSRNAATLVCEYSCLASEWISLGADCQVATVLREQGRRHCAYPLDWCLSLGNISSIVRDGIAASLTEWCEVRPPQCTGERAANRWGVFFAHEPCPDRPNIDRQRRRILRFLNRVGLGSECLTPIKEDEERFVRLVRASHKGHHHGGHPRCSARTDGPDWSGMCTDEIGAIQTLDAWFASASRPSVPVKLTLLLTCDVCFSPQTPTPSPTATCEVLNLFAGATPLLHRGDSNETINAAIAAYFASLVC